MSTADEWGSFLLEGDAAELSWQERALCAQTDPESFFPEKGSSTRAAKKVCLFCEVRSQCLAYALQNDERFGVWGGLSERERRRLKRGEPAPEKVGHPCKVCDDGIAYGNAAYCSDPCRTIGHRETVSRSRQHRAAA